ncbi:hypothetical protein AMIS_21110 [Actinoplanes missouriensis 431]|uniref:Uncharacterized protein n=1 Tax=Actinoplanes missouriensis (strain ATCC 14538 / DSM 43046 / CBS 188.64 / JCM 3121 / NBRC 102363 / NCIMB 12654 / NRRL B-3342 / UNCC 431) TaxID=512565 RepID=I0H2U4_ACTM4|nr:hypothetical protein [Actinoplanes missouriensis]BAL87331.1 hypothetical protein AMIS_21110 [Actinoplanes missouriensis 431]
MSGKHPYWPDLTDDEGDALAEWFDDTCGDCLEGRCHWGGRSSELSIEAAKRGVEFESYPPYGTCGCARHANSVLARPFDQAHDTAVATALAWRAAKESGQVELSGDDS